MNVREQYERSPKITGARYDVLQKMMVDSVAFGWFMSRNPGDGFDIQVARNRKDGDRRVLRDSSIWVIRSTKLYGGNERLTQRCNSWYPELMVNRYAVGDAARDARHAGASGAMLALSMASARNEEVRKAKIREEIRSRKDKRHIAISYTGELCLVRVHDHKDPRSNQLTLPGGNKESHFDPDIFISQAADTPARLQVAYDEWRADLDAISAKNGISGLGEHLSPRLDLVDV